MSDGSAGFCGEPADRGTGTIRHVIPTPEAAVRGDARYIDRGEVAGTVTLISRRGRVVHLEAQGLADLDSKTPMRTDSIFRIAP